VIPRTQGHVQLLSVTKREENIMSRIVALVLILAAGVATAESQKAYCGT
jgi:hypothetical protein